VFCKCSKNSEVLAGWLVPVVFSFVLKGFPPNKYVCRFVDLPYRLVTEMADDLTTLQSSRGTAN
jgi:hypothetical protein